MHLETELELNEDTQNDAGNVFPSNIICLFIFWGCFPKTSKYASFIQLLSNSDQTALGHEVPECHLSVYQFFAAEDA